jgi:triosephosphate isomerase (TIM)
MRQAWLGGNWKLNGSRELIAHYAQTFAGQNLKPEICALPPFPLLAAASDALSLSVGAQDLSEHLSGAYTGEVGAAQLIEAGARYVLVGHSERRQLHREDSALVARKFARAQDAGLIPVLCVGETLAERDSDQTFEVIGGQIDAVLDRVAPTAWGKALIAYEPVWAIGTGKTATPAQAQAVHAAIRSRIKKADAILADSLTIVYGGSVKESNADALFAQADIDGGLIGGASLNPPEFLAIAQALSRARSG